MTSLPKISVIIPVLNGETYIRKTLESIVAEKYANTEIIVVDGCSTDSTLDIVDEFRHSISLIISERDSGQADAIRKGILRSSGEIVNWINCDDSLYPGWFDALLKHYIPQKPLLICGAVENVTPYGSEGLIYNQHIRLESFLLNKGFSYHQPGVWICSYKPAFLADLIRTDLHYVFDHALMIELLKTNPGVVEVADRAAKFLIHPGSKTSMFQKRFHSEMLHLLSKEVFNNQSMISSDAITKSIRSFERQWGLRDSLIDLQANTNFPLHIRLLEIGKLLIKHPLMWRSRCNLGAIKRILLT